MGPSNISIMVKWIKRWWACASRKDEHVYVVMQIEDKVEMPIVVTYSLEDAIELVDSLSTKRGKAAWFRRVKLV